MLRADVYGSVVAIYNLDYLPLSLRKGGVVLETRANSENGEATVSLRSMDALSLSCGVAASDVSGDEESR